MKYYTDKEAIRKIKTYIMGKKYYYPVTTEIASDTEFTIPCNYLVGKNTLTVIFCGEVLIRATDSQDGHYYEVGTEGTVSNKIKLNGWKAEVGTGDDLEYFEFIVRGEYDL